MNSSLESQPVENVQPRRRWRVWGGLVVVALLLYLGGNYFNMSAIKVGDQAPDFSATTHSGQTIQLKDYLGKKAVVLYFYPKDNTSICTAQACAFRDAYEDFVAAGAEVIGVSSDSPESHRDFVAQQKLPFTLVSDEDGALRRAFGVPKTLGFLPGRVTYVIDRQGIVRHLFNSQLSSDRHIAQSLETVRGLANSSL